ncbi:MAG: dihydrodipicolinate synthase family protein [Planctomycetota bacterium]|nr:dihydrodipicolinate synthase family protein [Planctomycetota bacterium]
MPAKFSKLEWEGILAPILTPLTPDEQLDEGAFAAFAHKLLDEGQAGLYVTGGTGEEYGLDDAVRVEAFRLAARAARERGDGKKIIAHVGGVHLKRAVAMARAAADAGCHALAALPPHGGRYGFDDLTVYYRDLAAATPLPAFVYNIPVVTGLDLSREQLSRWLELPNVRGMKFTCTDMYKFERLATKHPEAALFHGHDPMLMHGVAVGATGAIGSTYNVLGPLALRIFKAVRDGDLPTARRAQGILNTFVEDFHACGRARALKAAVARRMGWKACVSPAPGSIPAPETVDRLDAALTRALRAAEELTAVAM